MTVKATDGQYTVSIDMAVSSIVGEQNISPIENTILLYPNPAHSQLNLHLDNNLVGKFEFDILDLNGRMMNRYHLFKAGRVLEYSVDIRGFSPGIYLVRIKHEQLVIHRRIIH